MIKSFTEASLDHQKFCLVPATSCTWGCTKGCTFDAEGSKAAGRRASDEGIVATGMAVQVSVMLLWVRKQHLRSVDIIQGLHRLPGAFSSAQNSDSKKLTLGKPPL